jgi:hypothetical protein
VAAAVACVLAAGCASMNEVDCRGTDWYDLGYRDALLALQPQDAIYARLCDPQGVKVDFARYAQGWREGKYEADDRHPGPIH